MYAIRSYYVHEIHGNHIPKNISLLTEYDAYYISKAGHLPLPVYRVNIDNEDKDTYYINPATGKYRHVNVITSYSIHYTKLYDRFRSYRN